MKNFVVILTISLILVFLCVAESIVIRNFCFDMEKSILDILKKISDDTCNENDIKNIEKEWSKHQTLVFVFVNHNIFEDYQKCISDMRYLYEFDKSEDLYFKAYSLYEINEKMKSLLKFNVGNIF